MKRYLIAAAFILATLAVVPDADARRGQSCANGQCGQLSEKAGSFTTANLTPKKWDASKHPKDPITGRFVEAPKAQEAADCSSGRQPVRKAGKAVARVGKAAGRVLLAPVRLLRRGHGCG